MSREFVAHLRDEIASKFTGRLTNQLVDAMEYHVLKDLADEFNDSLDDRLIVQLEGALGRAQRGYGVIYATLPSLMHDLITVDK